MKPWKYQQYKKDKGSAKIPGYPRDHNHCDMYDCPNRNKAYSSCTILSTPKVCGRYHVRKKG